MQQCNSSSEKLGSLAERHGAKKPRAKSCMGAGSISLSLIYQICLMRLKSPWLIYQVNFSVRRSWQRMVLCKVWTAELKDSWTKNICPHSFSLTVTNLLYCFLSGNGDSRWKQSVGPSCSPESWWFESWSRCLHFQQNFETGSTRKWKTGKVFFFMLSEL